MRDRNIFAYIYSFGYLSAKLVENVFENYSFWPERFIYHCFNYHGRSSIGIYTFNSARPLCFTSGFGWCSFILVCNGWCAQCFHITSLLSSPNELGWDA